MNDVHDILRTLIAASEQVPGVDADPESVLCAIEAMMERRKEAFEELREAIASGVEITAAMRAEAKRLTELDRAWSARAGAAMQTLSDRLSACRRMRSAVRGYRPSATAHIQV